MTKKANLPDVPFALADVALVDGRTAAAAAGVSVSQWLELVRRGKAPEPLRWGPRCSRWTVATVRAWLVERAVQGAGDAEAAVLTKARSTKASAAARAKRAANAGLQVEEQRVRAREASLEQE